MKEQRATTESPFADLHCENADFEFSVSTEKFRLDDFKKGFVTKGGKLPDEGVLFSAVASTHDAKSADYHVHLSWHISKNSVKLKMEYYKGARKPDVDEKEPFAETVMQWLGMFFRAEQAKAVIHAVFNYPIQNWRPLIPLPLKIPFEGEPELEIDGISVSLRKQPQGMTQAWLSTDEKDLTVLLHGHRTIRFDSFSVQTELAEMSECARILVSEVPK